MHHVPGISHSTHTRRSSSARTGSLPSESWERWATASMPFAQYHSTVRGTFPASASAKTIFNRRARRLSATGSKNARKGYGSSSGGSGSGGFALPPHTQGNRPRGTLTVWRSRSQSRTCPSSALRMPSSSGAVPSGAGAPSVTTLMPCWMWTTAPTISAPMNAANPSPNRCHVTAAFPFSEATSVAVLTVVVTPP